MFRRVMVAAGGGCCRLQGDHVVSTADLHHRSSFMIISMLCWGSWANTIKLCPEYRFQLFYWDYVVGLILGTFLGLQPWSPGHHGTAIPARCFAKRSSPHRPSGYRRHHLQRCQPVVGCGHRYRRAGSGVPGRHRPCPGGGCSKQLYSSPAGNPLMLFGGLLSLLPRSYLKSGLPSAGSRATKHKNEWRGPEPGGRSADGVLYPFVSWAMNGEGAPGPYATSFFFALGVGVCALVANSLLMRYPLDGKPPVSMAAYTGAPKIWHAWGIAVG